MSQRKACYSLKELEEAGLVQKELCGNGKPTKICIILQNRFGKAEVQKMHLGRQKENEDINSLKKGDYWHY